MKFVGIHIGHDSSLSFVDNGEIVVSVEEERFTREKNYRGFPFGSLKYMEDISGVGLSDVDMVAVCGNEIYEELNYFTLRSRFSTGVVTKKLFKYAARLAPNLFNKAEIKRGFIVQSLEAMGVSKEKIVFEDHHKLHAASAYFQAPFDDCLIVTSDGKGDDISSSIYTYDDGFKKHVSIDACSSIGQMYSAITMYLGFKPNRHEGKITGLAAYGDESKYGDELLELFDFDSSTGVYVSKVSQMVKSQSIDEIFRGFDHKLLTKKRILGIEYKIGREYELAFVLYLKIFNKIFLNASKEDVAAAAQYALEKLMVKYVSFWTDKLDKQYVCMAGGVFANVKLNQRILEISKVKNVFIQPAMGDSGLSLGAALLVASVNDDVKKALDTVYKGPEFSSDMIESTLIANEIEYLKFSSISEQGEFIANKINEGNLVGLFNGRMEFGPRALGARTVMISPKDKSINDIANKRFNRTEFMPFAPVILAEYAKDYFVGYDPDHIAAEFMTLTYDVFPEKQKDIEAVVHIDGTARPQVIKKEKNPLYYEILSQYNKLSGVPVTVNTSFNSHEEPILCTIENAINSYKNNVVDVLVLNNFVVSKRSA